MKKEMKNNLFFIFASIIFISLFFFFLSMNSNLFSMSGYSSIVFQGVDIIFDKNIPLEDIIWTFSNHQGVVWTNNEQKEQNGFDWNLIGIQDPKAFATLYAGEELSLNISINHLIDDYKKEDFSIEISNGSMMLARIHTICNREVWFGKAYTIIEGRINGKWRVLSKKATNIANCEKNLFGYDINSLDVSFLSPNDPLTFTVFNKKYTVDASQSNSTKIIFSMEKDASYFRTFSLRYNSFSILNDSINERYPKKEIIRLNPHTSVDSFTVYIKNIGKETIDENVPLVVEGTLWNKYKNVKFFRGEVSSEKIGIGKRIPVILYPVNDISEKNLPVYLPGTLYTLTLNMNEKESITESNYNNNKKQINICVGDCYREEQKVTDCVDSDNAGGAIGNKGSVTLSFADGRKISVTDECLSDSSIMEYSCEAFGSAIFYEGYWKKEWLCPKGYYCKDGACILN